jgi:hypothetical protein
MAFRGEGRSASSSKRSKTPVQFGAVAGRTEQVFYSQNVFSIVLDIDDGQSRKSKYFQVY